MITGNKHNIVNVDALHKYHTGVNIPSISEELINENVTSFKVGTSNVNGVDLTNQMEQSLVDVTYIKGKTVKENSKLNSAKVVFDSGEKELCSLQDRFYDEYKNGKLHKRIKKITPKDFEVIHMHSGLEHNWNNSSGTYAFYFNFIGGDCIDESALMCNILDAISYSDLTNGVGTGVFISKDWSWIGVRVDDNIIGVSSSDNDSQKFEKAKTWFFNSNIEIHYLVNEAITNESITILANPNEEINVISSTPTTIKHTVQLNTKAQVEEAQKQIVKSNKNIWQKLKELTEKFKNLTDAEMKLENNGYIKLPTAFGGLKLQWGLECVTANGVARDATKVVQYPTEFTQRVFFSHSNCYNSSWLTTGCTGEGLTAMTLCVVNLDSNALPQADFWLTWFAVGK